MYINVFDGRGLPPAASFSVRNIQVFDFRRVNCFRPNFEPKFGETIKKKEFVGWRIPFWLKVHGFATSCRGAADV